MDTKEFKFKCTEKECGYITTKELSWFKPPMEIECEECGKVADRLMKVETRESSVTKKFPWYNSRADDSTNQMMESSYNKKQWKVKK